MTDLPKVAPPPENWRLVTPVADSGIRSWINTAFVTRFKPNPNGGTRVFMETSSYDIEEDLDVSQPLPAGQP